jgi:hypothetical protein
MWYVIGERYDGSACILTSAQTRQQCVKLALVFSGKLEGYSHIFVEKASGLTVYDQAAENARKDQQCNRKA